MRRLLTYWTPLILLLLVLTSCGRQSRRETGDSRIPGHKARDLEEIKRTGVLKAVITFSETSYFLYRGQPMGYEFDLLERLADHLGVKLELQVAQDLNNLFFELGKGKADIIAHGLTITNDRTSQVAFTDYLYLTHQVLVQKKPDNWRQMRWSEIQKSVIKDPIELIGDTVSVRKNSSYYKRIQNLSDEIGGEIIINTLDGSLSTDRIIDMVVEGSIKYTVADNNLANLKASYYPVLNIEVPISFSQRIAWAVSPDSPELLDEINRWIKQEREQVDYYVIYNKYFKNKRDYIRRVKSDYYSLTNNQISSYDGLIKMHAERIGWDWRLLAALIYQESMFSPDARSWAGARGLMQLMPGIAKELGVKDVTDPAENIRGGTTYLKQLYDKFEEVDDSLQRMKFAMASYNCGYYHVRDAQRLAEKNGIDQMNWDEQVEKMILELTYADNYNDEVVKYGFVRGIEPFNYVQQIFERYEHYRELIK